MLTRPLTLKDGDDGLGLVVASSHPSLPLDNEADDDDETQTGLFFPPTTSWHSSSSSSSSPSPPPCASFSSPAHSQPASPTFHSPSPLTPPAACSSPDLSFSSLPLSPSLSSACPPPPVAPTLVSTASSTPFPSSTSLFSNMSPFSAPKFPVPPAPHSHAGSSSLFILPPLVLPSCVSSSTPVSTITTPSSVSPPITSLCISLSSSSPPVHQPFHLLPPSASSPFLVCNPTPPAIAVSTSIPHPSPQNTPPPAFHTPCPPPFSSSPSVPSTVFSPPTPAFSQFRTAPSVLPPAPPPFCQCSLLLPRLLSAHRLEVRRLLRGAMASLGRRLETLERKSGGKMRRRRSRHRGGEEGGREASSRVAAVSPQSPSSSPNSAHNLPVTSSSSSSDNEDSPTPPLCSGLNDSKQRRRRRRRSTEEGEEEERGKKRRRKIHRREMSIPLGNSDEDTEEEDTGRFVGRMAVSFRGGSKEDVLLTLHNFDHRKHRVEEERKTSQSEKAVTVVRRNGFRTPLLLHSSDLFTQNSPHLRQAVHGAPTCDQSEALQLPSGRFLDLACPLNPSTNQSAFRFWMCSSSSSSIRPALILRLSAVAVETVSETIRCGPYECHLWALKDWTAPPSLGSDHCYMQVSIPSPPAPARRQLKKRTNHSSRSLHLPRRRALPSSSANVLSTVLPTNQSPASDAEFIQTNGERGKRVSQIRIRRAPPRETSLTPMGLPKVKRLKKKEFSLEEIYTNKNYKSPNTNRSLETIFEEPRGKDGELLRIGHQRRRRLLLFPDFTQPRKRKRPQGVGLPVTTVPRKRAAARRNHGSSTTNDESDLDVMLVERLSALEDFLMRQGLDV